jgi:hypothetical protein
MRRLPVLLAWGLAVWPAPTARGDDPAAARAVIDRAIEAAGGPESLAKYERPFVIERKGKVVGRGRTQQFTQRITKWLPNRIRTEQRVTADGPVTFGFVFNGTKGWTMNLGKVVEMNAAAVAMQRDGLYKDWVATLAPLTDAAFRLSIEEEIILEKRPALGVKVSQKDRPDTRLYFDKETFALVKLVQQVNETSTYEDVYADEYGEVDGVVYPKRITVYLKGAAGQTQMEMEITKFEFIDPPAEDYFDHP